MTLQITDTLQVRADEADVLEEVLKNSLTNYSGFVSYSRGEVETLTFEVLPPVQIVLFTVTVTHLQAVMQVGEMLYLALKARSQ